MSGLQIRNYELQNPKAKIVPFRNVKVELILQDSQGGVAEYKTVLYQVGVRPHLSVLRSRSLERFQVAFRVPRGWIFVCQTLFNAIRKCDSRTEVRVVLIHRNEFEAGSVSRSDPSGTC